MPPLLKNSFANQKAKKSRAQKNEHGILLLSTGIFPKIRHEALRQASQAP